MNLKEPQPTPIPQEPSSHSMNLQGSLWGHGGGGCVLVKTRRSLGYSSVTATSSYIGVTDNSALDLARVYSF